MKYYIPDIKLSVLLNKQTLMEDKLGGLPWGMPANKWPICRQCNNPMLLLAQLSHNGTRLDLGAPGRVLHLFQCGSDCDTWSHESGANSCFVLEAEVMTHGLTVPPNYSIEKVIDEWAIDYVFNFPDRESIREKYQLQAEVRVLRWIEEEDGISPEDAKYFTNSQDFWNMPDTIKDPYCGTKLGSVPCWVQTPELEGLSFIGQLADNYFFTHSLPKPDEVGCSVGKVNILGCFKYYEPKKRKPSAPRFVAEIKMKSSEQKSKWVCEGPNFGDGGIGYIFLKRNDPHLPECKFIWQCS
jgi:hypothetical protein